MKTPAGFECQYFYGDYYRGRKREECRLIEQADPPRNWKPNLCRTCPIPIILRANACENMILQAKVKPGLVGMGKRVIVTAFCKKAQKVVDAPEIGCGLCHTLPPVFTDERK